MTDQHNLDAICLEYRGCAYFGRMCRCGGFHCCTRPQQSTIMFLMKSLLAAPPALLWENKALSDLRVLHGILFFRVSVVELGRVDVGLTFCCQLPMGLSDLSGCNSPPPPPTHTASDFVAVSMCSQILTVRHSGSKVQCYTGPGWHCALGRTTPCQSVNSAGHLAAPAATAVHGPALPRSQDLAGSCSLRVKFQDPGTPLISLHLEIQSRLVWKNGSFMAPYWQLPRSFPVWAASRQLP
jgi:hypothetical protein